MSSVSLTRINGQNIKQAIEDSLDLIGYTFKKDLRSVVIKANMCFYWDYSTGHTTDPKFIAGLVDLIREKTSPNVDIAVVESDASAMKCKYAFKVLGFDKLSKSHNIRLVNLSEDKTEVAQVTCNGQSFRFKVPQIIKNADLRINVPKIKYSSEQIKLTCALKNIFGCNPYPTKYKYHPHLEKTIVAINKAMKFDLSIIDGNIVTGSQTRKLGLVMASQDPVAIDAAAAQIAGINPKTIKYLKLAHNEGLGNTVFITKGLPISHFRNMFPRKDVKKKLMARVYLIVTRLRLGKRLGLG